MYDADINFRLTEQKRNWYYYYYYYYYDTGSNTYGKCSKHESDKK